MFGSFCFKNSSNIKQKYLFSRIDKINFQIEKYKSTFEKSPIDRLDKFATYIKNQGIMITVRRSRGKDIDAACGQLANKD
jgi:adenine C2-methylase RlmN of 23S rRNA A2503 and tRNA A37